MRAPRPVESFLLEGRISVRQDQTRHYANISWRHDVRSDDIFLATPLGQGVAELHRDENGARLIMADRQQRLADDWEDLAAQLFGIRLPLAGLPAWVTGQAPAPASGWQVDYPAYTDDSPDALPTLVELRRGGDLEIRIKVDQWSEVR